MLQAQFFSRTLIPLPQPPVDLAVQTLSWAALGGPKQAYLQATGPEPALWNLAQLLRSPIEIQDERGCPVWWGYVETVEIACGRVGIKASLAGMANRLAVVYAHLPAGASQAGARKTSAWRDDLDSQAAYGIKEMLLSLDSASDEQALQRRDAELALRSSPILSLSVLKEPADSPTARITCQGWWEMYGWRRHARPAGYIGHETTSPGVQTLGSLSTDTQMAQSFTLSTDSWRAEQVWVRVRKVGSPSDGLKLDLAANDNGAPGVELASLTIPASEISAEDYLWTGGGLNARVQLAAGTGYWLRLRRTGSVDANNYYQIDVDENLGFNGGEMKIYTGSAWMARSPAADLVFKALGVEETTDQVVAAALGDREDDFVLAADLTARSGVYSCPYRDGDHTRLEVLCELLESGTSDGKPLLATIGRDRVLAIQVRPDPGEGDWTIDRSGQLYDEFGCPAPAYTSPAGRWICFREPLAGSGLSKTLNQPLHAFVTSAEYDALSEKMVLRFEE